MSQLLSRVGPVRGAAGSSPALRSGDDAELIVGQVGGKYYELSRRGKLFVASSGGLTPGTAVGTTAAFCLYNPPGSGLRFAIKRVRVGYGSGTLGAGSLLHCANYSATQAAPTGAALTSRCTDVGNTGAGVGVALGNATVAAPVVLGPICSLDAELASSVTGLRSVSEDVDGEITVQPGCTYQIQAVAAAGAAPTLYIGVTWGEIALAV